MEILKIQSSDLTPQRVEQIEKFLKAHLEAVKLAGTFSPGNLPKIKTLLDSGVLILFLMVEGADVVGAMTGGLSPDARKGKELGTTLLSGFVSWGQAWDGLDTMRAFSTYSRQNKGSGKDYPKFLR